MPGSDLAGVERGLVLWCCQVVHSPEGEGDLRSSYKMVNVLKSS